MLDQAERASHDTTALLAGAAAQRELDSADSISEVLWRLQRLGYVTSPASVPRSRRPRTEPAPAVPAPAAVAHQEANRPQRR
ncbi:hypothetical protein ACWGQL_13045 [Streptomyces lydicus]